MAARQIGETFVKKNTTRSIILFVYLLTFGIAFPATPACPCRNSICGFGAGVRRPEAPDRACHARNTVVRTFSDCTCGEHQTVSRPCSGCDRSVGGEFKSGCRCDIHSRPLASEVYLWERTISSDRLNTASLTAEHMKGGSGFYPRTARITRSGSPFPRNELLHRCLILVM
jgi:hypothetical protein